MNYKNKSFKKKAFTLVELLIVIAIISILFIVLISKVDFATDKAKATGVQTDFRSFQVAFETVARENSGFNTFGWDTGDLNANGKRDSYDEGDTNKDNIQDSGEIWTGHKVPGETFTKVFTLVKPGTDFDAVGYDSDAIAKLETAINANLDPKLHITIATDGTITMANGAQDPWNKEYHGNYITNATVDKKDQGAMVMYSDGANNEFGSEHKISNGVVSISIPGNNKYGKDDYSVVVVYTYLNGYGEIKTATGGFSNNIGDINTGNSNESSQPEIIEPEVVLPEAKEDLKDYTWDEIKNLADAQLLNYDDYGIQLGDTITLNNGTTLYLVDFNNYGGFCFLYIGPQSLSNISISDGSYSNSSLSETINSYFDTLDVELQNVIKTVDVVSSDYSYMSADYTSMQVQLFVASAIEVGTSSSVYVLNEGMKYEYFLNNTIRNIVGNGTKTYFTRSEHTTYSGGGRIGIDGRTTTCNATGGYPLVSFVVGSNDIQFVIPEKQQIDLPNIKSDLADYTWTEIDALASQGWSSEQYSAYGIQLGDKKENKILVDFDNYGGFTFMFSTNNYTRYHVNYDGGCFANMNVYQWLSQYDVSQFSSELLSVISPVDIGYFDCRNLKNIVKTERVFVPSVIEVGGQYSSKVASSDYFAFYEDEADVFDYFKDGNGLSVFSSTTATRSPGNSSSWWVVSSSFKNYSGSDSYYFNLCFVVGKTKQSNKLEIHDKTVALENDFILTTLETTGNLLHVKVDGDIIGADNYNVSFNSNSTSVIFTNEYAISLNNGEHKVQLVFENGTATCIVYMDIPKLPIPKNSLNEYTWDEIKSLSYFNLSSETLSNVYNINIGDYKSGYQGREYYLVDIDNEYDGFVFIWASHLYVEDMNVNSYGYPASNIYSLLEDYYETDGSFAELKRVIKQVPVAYTTLVSGTFQEKTVYSYLFAPSVSEFGFSRSNGVHSETFELFKTSEGRNKVDWMSGYYYSLRDMNADCTKYYTYSASSKNITDSYYMSQYNSYNYRTMVAFIVGYQTEPIKNNTNNYDCVHTYQNGYCVDCGFTCSHRDANYTYSSNNDGKTHTGHLFCNICGITQNNVGSIFCNFVNSQCVDCQQNCAHKHFANEQCVFCGMPCPHYYVDNICVTCNKQN